MSRYTDFIANVRAWANRDADVLPDTVIADAMSYAADKAYKHLKIPALEAEAEYTVIAQSAIPTSAYQVKLSSTAASNSTSLLYLPVPSNLISFIHLRVKTGNSNEGIVIQEKTDTRTFHDMYADRYTSYYWTRQAGNIIAAGNFAEGDVLELFYYRRLPSLDARYLVSVANFNALFMTPTATQATTGTTMYFANGTTYPPTPGVDTAYATQDPTNSRVAFIFDADSGDELDNWLRDENQQVILFGALQQCFDYLDDDVQANKYKIKFAEAIEELNKEDKVLRASGGNVQMHFNSQLI